MLLAAPAAAKPCGSLSKQIDAKAAHAVCTRVKAKRSLQLVTYQIADPNDPNETVPAAALFSGDAMRWQGAGSTHATLESIYTYSVADLDSDGRDELLVIKLRFGHEHYDHTELEAYRMRDDGTPEAEAAMVLPLGASRKYPDATCVATYKIVSGVIVVSRKRTGAERAEECEAVSRYDFRATRTQ
jgi:hypothetical protein